MTSPTASEPKIVDHIDTLPDSPRSYESLRFVYEQMREISERLGIPISLSTQKRRLENDIARR